MKQTGWNETCSHAPCNYHPCEDLEWEKGKREATEIELSTQITKTDALRARVAQLEEALRESWCWRWTCEDTTPAELGAKLDTFDEVIRMVDAALSGSTTEWLEGKIAEAKTEAVVACIEMLKKGMTRAAELEGGKG